MKKRIAFLLFAALGIGCILATGNQSEAKKLKNRKCSSLYVQQGKTYKLSKILSDVKDVEEGDSLKNCLEGKKVTWSANKKKVKLTKKKIKIKKKGKVKITGKTKKYKYVITLEAVPEKWPEIPAEISRITITYAGYFKDNSPVTLEIKDTDRVQALCRLLNSADYRFDYYASNHNSGGWLYWFRLYYSDGRQERQFLGGIIVTEGSLDFRQHNKAIDMHNYLKELCDALVKEQIEKV